jgi:DNA-directed RNA polymerase beta' subunit
MATTSKKEHKIRPNVKKALEELRTNPNLQPITEPPLRPVKNIQFGFLSPEEIKAISVCCIKNSRVANPPTDTVYDERMGPAHSRGICSTCNEDIRICPGHFGHIELVQPILHPMFLKFVTTILNCICLNCSKLRMTREEIDLEINVIEHDRFIRYVDRINIIVKKCSNVAYCSDCKYPHPDIKDENGQIFKVYDSMDKKATAKKKTLIEIQELQNILSKISNEDLHIMGFQPQERKIWRHGYIEQILPTFRPEWLILTYLPVLPSMSRPPNNEGDHRSDDDLTTSYTDIVKINERLKDKNMSEMTKEFNSKQLYKHIKGLFDNSDGSVTRSSGKAAKSIKERICGKDGHIRGKLMGKRVDCSARTVITADPMLYLNEVGVPEEIARTLSFPEKVTSRNIKELSILLEENKINTIIRNGIQTRVAFALQACKQTGRVLKLHIGDLIYRQLRDGDTVVFNRQPTLHRGSMMAHIVRVLPGRTFRLNLSVTTPYNADFDG